MLGANVTRKAQKIINANRPNGELSIMESISYIVQADMDENIFDEFYCFEGNAALELPLKIRWSSTPYGYLPEFLSETRIDGGSVDAFYDIFMGVDPISFPPEVLVLPTGTICHIDEVPHLDPGFTWWIHPRSAVKDMNKDLMKKAWFRFRGGGRLLSDGDDLILIEHYSEERTVFSKYFSPKEFSYDTNKNIYRKLGLDADNSEDKVVFHYLWYLSHGGQPA